MMFMMPMPPTSKLTAATALRSPVMTVVVDEKAATIWVMSRTEKSSSSLTPIWRVSRNMAFMLLCTDPRSSAVMADTRLDLGNACVAGNASLIGAQGHDHGIVLVGAKCRLALCSQHATTSHGTPVMRMVAPIAFTDCSSSRRTVSPMTHTVLPPRTSLSVKGPPSVKGPVLGNKEPRFGSCHVVS